MADLELKLTLTDKAVIIFTRENTFTRHNHDDLLSKNKTVSSFVYNFMDLIPKR
jgi:hypothetical protein